MQLAAKLERSDLVDCQTGVAWFTAKPEMMIRSVLSKRVNLLTVKPEMSRYQITPTNRANDMVGGSFLCDTTATINSQRYFLLQHDAHQR